MVARHVQFDVYVWAWQGQLVNDANDLEVIVKVVGPERELDPFTLAGDRQGLDVMIPPAETGNVALGFV